METGSIFQTIEFNCGPEELYELLMDAKKHEAFTGAPVEMSREIGGTFTIFEGYCHGRNLELNPGKKIVQLWHFAEEGWPDQHFSTCTFVFEKVGEKTLLHFSQTEVPLPRVEALNAGWNEYYWDAMKEYLQSN